MVFEVCLLSAVAIPQSKEQFFQFVSNAERGVILRPWVKRYLVHFCRLFVAFKEDEAGA